MITIRNTIDAYYQQGKHQEAYNYLLEQLQLAMQENKNDLVLGIISELMGYCRVHAKFDLGNTLASRAVQLIENMGIQESIEAATTYLNIATLYKVEQKYHESLAYFLKCETIFEQLLDKNDERYVSLLNNISLLFQEIGDYKKAIETSHEALVRIKEIANCEIEEAITYTNLAQMYFQINDRPTGMDLLEKGIELFKIHGNEDPHYFAALSSLAQSYFMIKDYHKAKEMYQEVLTKIESVYGKNSDYQIVLKNYEFVVNEEKNQNFGLELSKSYYFDIAKPILQDAFPTIFPLFSIGLFGMGSECLGYDDEYSRDHDFGPGFVILVPNAIYEQYGKQIQEVYDRMPKEYRGFIRQVSNRGQNRVGVFSIETYFLGYLGKLPDTILDWFDLDEQALLMMTSGMIFEDPSNQLGLIRKKLQYYPSDVRIKKIVKQIAIMAQSGQYNYPRCITRKDIVAGELAFYTFLEASLACVYLLNSQYKPYYKWTYRGLRDVPLLQDVVSLIKELVIEKDCKKRQVMIEAICIKIGYELNRQELSSCHDAFLEMHVDDVMKHIKDPLVASLHIMEG